MNPINHNQPNKAPQKHAIAIAGAGPTGLTLAAELALAGVDVVVLERRREGQAVIGTRAGGLHARTLELFDQRGIAGRFIAEGQPGQFVGFAGARLDISDFPTRHNYVLGLWQKHIERILTGWVGELRVPIRYSVEVTAFAPDETGVDVTLSDGTSLRAEYLVGCDGGRSFVRKHAGIEFPGWDPTSSALIAEVEMAEEPPLGIHRNPFGTHAFGRVEYEIKNGEIVYKNTGPIGVMVSEEHVGATNEPTLADLSAALIAACGTDYGLRSATSISRFGDTTRQAATYRKGRVLVAGDAAHVHAPDGGQGLNIGVHDAMNLGWKLAQVVKGISPESLLDTYHQERHPAGARVLQKTMASVALRRPDDRTTAVRETMAELLGIDEARRRMAGMLSGLDVHYELGDGHPLLGRRMPDLDVVTTSGPARVFALLQAARPVLLRLDGPGAVDVAPWADRISSVEARTDGPWELPVLGKVPAPAAVLIRPDGIVAWAGDRSETGLAAALTTWCGAPR